MDADPVEAQQLLAGSTKLPFDFSARRDVVLILQRHGMTARLRLDGPQNQGGVVGIQGNPTHLRRVDLEAGNRGRGMMNNGGWRMAGRKAVNAGLAPLPIIVNPNASPARGE